MKAILGFIVTRRVTSSLGPTLVLSALVWLGGPHWAQAGINEWTTNGPYGGSVPILVIDPQTPSTLYAGYFGIAKSTDAGMSWTTVLPYAYPYVSYLEALAIDPQTPTTLYAGARYSGAFYPTWRLIKSTDGGATWSNLDIPGTNGFVRALAIDPQSPAILYIGTDNHGTFKSTDGGASWTAVLSVSARTLAIDPQTPAIVYAGASDSVYKSSNGGSTWSAVDLTPAPNQSVGWVRALAIAPLTPSTLYAGAVSAGSSSAHGGLFKSTDGGTTWSVLDTGSMAQFNAVAIDPRTPTTLYAGGVAAFKSTDGGDRWRSIGLSGYVSFRALAIDPVTPTTLYAVVDAPTPPTGPGPLDGVFQGIDFGTGQWAWEGPYGAGPTNHIYFANSTGTSRTFAFSPAPRVLERRSVFSPTPGTMTLTDDAGQTRTYEVTTVSTQLVTTGWSGPSTTVTVSFTDGWALGIDDITSSTAP